MSHEKSLHQLQVEMFMHCAGQQVPNAPTTPDAATRLLRAKLIMEEALELVRALGVQLYCDGDGSVDLLYCDLGFADLGESAFDLTEVIDGCCDLKVVTTGTLSACGVWDVYPQTLVDLSNLEKFGPGGHRREDGKWVKPPDWKAPNWEAEIARQKRKRSS